MVKYVEYRLFIGSQYRDCISMLYVAGKKYDHYNSETAKITKHAGLNELYTVR